MSVREAIYDLLNDTSSEVWPLKVPQEKTDPYVTFFMRRAPVRTQDGIDVEDVDLTLNIYASTHEACVTLADAMYAGLEGATGTYATESLMICNWESETDDYLDGLEKVVITQEYNLKFN